MKNFGLLYEDKEVILLPLQVIKLCKICVLLLTVKFEEQIISQVNQQSQSSGSKLMQ